MIAKLQWAVVIVVSMVLGAGVVIGVDSLRSDDSPGTGSTAVQEPADTGTASINVEKTISDTADLYDEVRPSIVLISSSNVGGGSGTGSGIVLDRDGHILTNNHVIAGYNVIDVTFWDGTSARASVAGTDPGNDLAVLKVDVDREQLRPARLGDSDSVRVGEFVIAVGNPFGREGTMTTGVISGVGRTLSGGAGRPLRQLLQSDAAINPGNSGGALFNSRGEVIGVTTAIENPTGDRVFAGIGYAVPINTAKRFMPDMLAGARVEHPRLGVQLQDLTPARADSLGLPVTEGVIILGVEQNTAAARAGLRGSRTGQGADVIVKLDNTPVRTFDDLASYIDNKKVGDTVKVTIIREGREMTIDVVLEAWQSNSA